MICHSKMDCLNLSYVYPCEKPYNGICLNLMSIYWLSAIRLFYRAPHLIIMEITVDSFSASI